MPQTEDIQPLTGTNASLADPLSLSRGAAMGNRFMLAPLTNLQSHADGTLGEDELRWLAMRAEGGFGLTMTCAAFVQTNGKGFTGQLGISSDAHMRGLERLARTINAKGSLSSVQLQHSGRRVMTSLTGVPAVCPWDDPETGARALSTGQVEQMIEDFILAAIRAEEAGFHGIELHSAHGYLLSQFLDAGNNQRNDRYGGSFENRTRLLFEIIDGIRSRTGSQFQLGIRLSPERYGTTIDEARQLAGKILLCGQVDYLDMSLWSVFKQPDGEAHRGKLLIDHFTDLPRGNTRLGVAGKIFDTATARACLDHGADFVLIGRGAILHHDFPRRATASAEFQCIETPVSRSYLAQEGLGSAFIDYLASNWRDFVAGDAQTGQG